ncbi:6-phospho-3-hexuloisomerase [Mesobacillus maritimus]|uniref:6-phospho-3-hexuloisomerase n=1 Tax=Mesobacillus maritimus TaxID=1643336 RepID=A0ABS7KAA2_9BACI|nr:6-phospho-3-hexuloisomerase [Mesobacillus maritimus]MBY0099201.1 6-phospho-3-hexuloisomerase [Mesobacillus maritimus]
MKKIIETVASEISGVLGQIDENEAAQLGNELENAKRIFIAGTGRSGLVGKVFAMRLMHSGYSVYVVGETITPSIETGDLLLAISGSGSTGSLVQYAKTAKKIDAKVALVTTNKESVIGELSDCVITIPAATKKRLPSEPDTIQPLGSQFDQSAHLLLDAIIVYLQQLHPEGKSHSSLNQKHANLE